MPNAPPLSPREVAEALLARELRVLGMARGRAMLVAEANGDRLTIDADGTVTVTLADGTTFTGEDGIRRLALELSHGA